jgi:hypothetical protein
MDTEYSRLKERMENMNHMLDDIQVIFTSCVSDMDPYPHLIYVCIPFRIRIQKDWKELT